MKKRELKLHPAILLFLLTIIVMVISSVGSILNLETTYYNVNAVTGELETQIVTINNLFNRTGLQYLFANMLNNFISFAFGKINLYLIEPHSIKETSISI